MTKSQILQTAKPILFSREMVRAILAGHKTQTRRVIKPSGKHRDIDISLLDNPYQIQGLFKPPHKPGDYLYVRETWHTEWTYGSRIFYRADFTGTTEEVYCLDKMTKFKWQPSIHMPKAAARIFLRVTDVRAERLQDITEEDAIAEGVRIGIGGEPYFSCRDAYLALWDSQYAKRGYPWGSNPWVYVYKFERVEVTARVEVEDE
jgi:hypothetical protein